MSPRAGRYIWAIFIVAAVIRILVIATHYDYLHPDEAVLGLMGKHVLEGRGFPVFYYGQPYMGSLEAYVAALFFAAGGISTLTLRLSPWLFSLAFLAAVYLSARRLGPPSFAVAVLLLAALPPSFFTCWCVWARGGFIEALLWGQLSLLFLFGIFGNPRVRGYYVGVGLSLGLGFWTNPLIMPYLLTSACFIFFVFRSMREGRVSRALILAASFGAGALPLILYNIVYPGATLVYLLKSFAGISRGTWDAEGVPGSLGVFLQNKVGLNTATLPRNLAFMFRVSRCAFLNLLSYGIYGAGLLLFLWWGVRRRFRLTDPARYRMVGCYILLLVLSLFLGCSGKFIPRYFLPLYSVYPIVLALVLFHLKDRSTSLFLFLFALVLLLSGVGTINILLYPPRLDFTPVVSALDQRGIDRGYSEYELCYPVNFRTRERIILTPGLSPGTERYAPYAAAVDFSENPVYIFSADTPAEETFARHLARKSIDYGHEAADGYSLYYDVKAPPDSVELKNLLRDAP